MLKRPPEERNVENNSDICDIVSSIVLDFLVHHKNKNFGVYTQILDTIDKSAMKQPTTNHSSNPKPIVIRTTYESISQSEDYKTNIDKEKTAQICRFFTLWGYFYPYTNRGGGNNTLLKQQR